MNRQDWQALEEAADILQLGESASLGEIKRAYHRLSKLYRPDTATSNSAAPKNQEKMYQLTAAYELLMAHLREYRFPLRQEAQIDAYDPEEWWRSRFEENIFGDVGKKKKR